MGVDPGILQEAFQLPEARGYTESRLEGGRFLRSFRERKPPLSKRTRPGKKAGTYDCGMDLASV